MAAVRKKRLSKAEQQARDADIVLMRRAQTSFTAIGDKHKITAVRAGQIYREQLAANPLGAMQVDEHRMEELEMIEMATMSLLKLAASNAVDQNQRPLVSPRTKVEAWSAIRAWREHKAKLFGLNAPTRAEVVTIGHLDQKIIELEAALGLEPGADLEQLLKA